MALASYCGISTMNIASVYGKSASCFFPVLHEENMTPDGKPLSSAGVY